MRTKTGQRDERNWPNSAEAALATIEELLLPLRRELDEALIDHREARRARDLVARPDAEQVIELVQAQLRSMLGDRLAIPRPERTRAPNALRPLALRLAWAHEAALRIIYEYEGESWRRAKEEQIRLSNGQPLTICVGSGFATATVYPERGRPEVATKAWPITGCGLVFPDTRQTTRRIFRKWCPECNGRVSTAKRSAERLIGRIDWSR